MTGTPWKRLVVAVLAQILLPSLVLAVSLPLREKLLASGVNEVALEKALQYLQSHAESLPNQRYLSLIDYSMPSSEKRYFLFDLTDGSVERLLVAHGRNSGLNESTSFSNEAESYKSSLGFFETGDVYIGKHGTSLRLEGLSPTNSNAMERAIVIHAADYVNEELIKVQGRIGRSLGCPALNPKVNDRVVEQIKGGSLVYSFFEMN